MKKVMFVLALLFLVGFIGFFVFDYEDKIDEKVGAKAVRNNMEENVEVDSGVVDYGKYNVDFMNDRVKGILVGRMGVKKTDFYLPPTGYINVSRGSKYGVAFVIQNVNPTVPEGNYFEYNFNVDPGSVADCGVSVQEAQGWIERGWTSYGVIGGQWREDWNEWYDSMTVYFSFPELDEACSVRYDFEIEKDGVFYDSRSLEFNLV